MELLGKVRKRQVEEVVLQEIVIPEAMGGKSFKNKWSPGSYAFGSSCDVKIREFHL